MLLLPFQKYSHNAPFDKIFSIRQRVSYPLRSGNNNIYRLHPPCTKNKKCKKKNPPNQQSHCLLPRVTSLPTLPHIQVALFKRRACLLPTSRTPQLNSEQVKKKIIIIKKKVQTGPIGGGHWPNVDRIYVVIIFFSVNPRSTVFIQVLEFSIDHL